jgi:putative transposase
MRLILMAETRGQHVDPRKGERTASRLDVELAKFARRILEVEYPHLVMAARYEKVRIDGVIRTQAVLVALGSRGWAGARCLRWSWPIVRA